MPAIFVFSFPDATQPSPDMHRIIGNHMSKLYDEYVRSAWGRAFPPPVVSTPYVAQLVVVAEDGSYQKGVIPLPLASCAQATSDDVDVAVCVIIYLRYFR